MHFFPPLFCNISFPVSIFISVKHRTFLEVSYIYCHNGSTRRQHCHPSLLDFYERISILHWKEMRHKLHTVILPTPTWFPWSPLKFSLHGLSISLLVILLNWYSSCMTISSVSPFHLGFLNLDLPETQFQFVV